MADFNISFGGEKITCSPAPDTPIETIRHLLLDQVLPLCLNLRGDEALHASAVATPRGVCGFLGETGAGKSTLAASLVESGCALFGDDCLAIREVNGEIVALPTYAGFRLWPATVTAMFGDRKDLTPVSHFNSKRRVPIDDSLADSPQALAALYVLSAPQTTDCKLPELQRLSTAESLTELLQQAFRLDVTDREMLARQFRFIGRLLERIPVYRLSYPREFSMLPAVRQLICESLECSGSKPF